jgi:hypothetical protein
MADYNGRQMPHSFAPNFGAAPTAFGYADDSYGTGACEGVP